MYGMDGMLYGMVCRGWYVVWYVDGMSYGM